MEGWRDNRVGHARDPRHEAPGLFSQANQRPRSHGGSLGYYIVIDDVISMLGLPFWCQRTKGKGGDKEEQ